MISIKRVFLISVLSPFFAFSQCDEEIVIRYSDVPDAKYIGCLNDAGNPDGSGVLTHEQFKEEGNFKNGELDGLGKRIYFEDNVTIEGEWKGGKIVNGTYLEEGSDYELRYEGPFNEMGRFNGAKGYLRIEQSGLMLEKKGKFINGDLQQGSMIEVQDQATKKDQGNFVNGELYEGSSVLTEKSGLVISSNVKEGLAIESKRNDTNYYNSNDIQGDQLSSQVKLTKEGSENEGISYKIEMEINGISGEWIFDTGAQLFSIGKRMFDRLKNEGITYRELNQTVKTFGIGGSSNGKLVIIDEIKVGDYVVKNVVAKVSLDTNFSLMGIGFFSKFSDVSWSMSTEELTFFK
ncbi:retroviral-like aspartic protease family protein [Cyclobacteriaceae bacterium]|nr:retroviral-like aspartic protease family protein [Cyclobacteriaceae bacterium]